MPRCPGEDSRSDLVHQGLIVSVFKFTRKQRKSQVSHRERTLRNSEFWSNNNWSGPVVTINKKPVFRKFRASLELLWNPLSALRISLRESVKPSKKMSKSSAKLRWVTKGSTHPGWEPIFSPRKAISSFFDRMSMASTKKRRGNWVSLS